MTDLTDFVTLHQWLPLLTTQDDVEKTFQSMKSAGIKVLRTWVRYVLLVKRVSFKMAALRRDLMQ
jgi:hypothetical protein